MLLRHRQGLLPCASVQTGNIDLWIIIMQRVQSENENRTKITLRSRTAIFFSSSAAAQRACAICVRWMVEFGNECLGCKANMSATGCIMLQFGYAQRYLFSRTPWAGHTEHSASAWACKRLQQRCIRCTKRRSHHHHHDHHDIITSSSSSTSQQT